MDYKFNKCFWDELTNHPILSEDGKSSCNLYIYKDDPTVAYLGDLYVDESISIGDYILTGGEVAGLAIIDSVIRLLPDALGNNESSVDESFENNLLEYPQYTRPISFDGYDVPNILTSGNHELIRRWRRYKSLETTYLNRPDLLEKCELSKEDLFYLETIKNGGYTSDAFFNHKKIK